jgi:hypothetical protein
LTLYVYSALSRVLRNHKKIHHSILNSLYSPYEVEVKAAAIALKRLSFHSRSFAESAFHKLTLLIEDKEISEEIKLSLLSVFGQLRYTMEMNTQSRRVCLKLLRSFSAKSFVVVILDTLTTLALRSGSHVKDQVALLCTAYIKDPRESVRRVCLINLLKLSNGYPELFEREHFECLYSIVSLSHRPLAYQILCKIHRSSVSSVATLRDSASGLCYSRARCFSEATVILKNERGNLLLFVSYLEVLAAVSACDPDSADSKVVFEWCKAAICILKVCKLRIDLLRRLLNSLCHIFLLFVSIRPFVLLAIANLLIPTEKSSLYLLKWLRYCLKRAPSEVLAVKDRLCELLSSEAASRNVDFFLLLSDICALLSRWSLALHFSPENAVASLKASSQFEDTWSLYLFARNMLRAGCFQVDGVLQHLLEMVVRCH